MSGLNKPRLIAHLAVFSVVLALLFFTTVRVSPIATDSASLNKVNLKQRNLNIDVAVAISLAPYIVPFVPVAVDSISARSESISLLHLDDQFVNRPPPVVL